MARTLAWFQNSCALNSPPVMQAFLKGAQRHGFEIRPDSMTADVAVIWSVLWHGRMKVNKLIYDHYRSHKKPVIVIDIGALNRGVTWKVAVNHVTSQGYYGHKENLDPDRPAKLGLALSQPTKSRSDILVCSQHSASMQVSDLDSVETWINNVIRTLTLNTDRTIFVRPHPRSPINQSQIFFNHVSSSNVHFQMPKKLANTYDSFDCDFNYHAVVNHNSGPGIQAALAGTRPLVSSTSLAHPVSVDWSQIEDPYEIDRKQWLIEIAHTEYTVDELAAGLCFPRIEHAL